MVDVTEIERVFREQYGRAVAVLVRQFGDIGLAEESVQDAFATAVDRWPSSGVPPGPAASIRRLYDQLMAIAPSPVAAVNRAVAIAEVDGAAAALGELDALGLDTYYLFHAIRADLLRRLGRDREAAVAYAAAIARTDNACERAFLERRRRELGRAAR